MDISLQSLIFFIIITILYFSFPSIGKPALTLNDLENDQSKSAYFKQNMTRLALYVGIVVLSQFILNINYLVAKCGGSMQNNIGAAALFTFIPWILIFGIMVTVLIVFPGFKSAFSDVIGYYAITMSASDIFGEILIDKDVNNALKDPSISADKRNAMEDAAQALMKIIGNKSILINQMNTENFLIIWDNLKPLIKPQYQTNTDMQLKLLNLVVLKENIGEALWYIYTAILISSVVYYNLASRGCVKSSSQMKSEYDTYVQQQEEIDKQQEISNSVTYTNTA